jgi:hypothetical protein
MKIVCPFQVLSKLDNLDNFNNHFTQRSNAVLFNFLFYGTLFQTEIFHGTPPLICIGNTHKVIGVVKIVDSVFLLVGK